MDKLEADFQIEQRTRRFARRVEHMSEEEIKAKLVSFYRVSMTRQRRHIANIGKAWGITK